MWLRRDENTREYSGTAPIRKRYAGFDVAGPPSERERIQTVFDSSAAMREGAVGQTAVLLLLAAPSWAEIPLLHRASRYPSYGLE
jgi:hypothetical protein